MVAVPSLFGVKLIPNGNVPLKLTVALGSGGLVLTVKLAKVPTTNVVLLALVIAGGGLFTNTVNVCVASGAIPLLAVTVSEWRGAPPKSGIPWRVSVPRVWSSNERD